MTIFVLIDALGWKILEGRAEFLADVLPWRTPLRTVLGFSSGAIPTILTGRPPADTGHWNLLYFNPGRSMFSWLRHFRFLPDGFLGHRIIRRLLTEAGRRLFGLGPAFECCVHPKFLPYFDWVEKNNIYDEGGIPGTPTILDKLASRRIPYRVYSYHSMNDERILQQAGAEIAARQAEFYFLYLSEMDMFLHTHCDSLEKYTSRLEWYEQRLRSLFQAAPGATIILASDHGMTPVRSTYDLLGEIGGLKLAMPEDYLAVYDSTMARFWFFSDAAREKVLDCLGRMPCGRIIPDSELLHLGVYFEDRRFGEVIFLLHPGWLLARSDFNGARWHPVGMHGYHPSDPHSDAVFLSNRKPPVPMQTIADVYTCLTSAAGI